MYLFAFRSFENVYLNSADSVRGHVPGRDRSRTRVSVQLRRKPEKTKDNQPRLGLRHRVHNLLTGELNGTSAICQPGKLLKKSLQFY